MVSFHTPRKMVKEIDESSKKRKWPDEAQLKPSPEFLNTNKPSKARNMQSIFNSETPLPLEWQRCLDIKSGHIYYMNTRTNKKTSKDPRVSPEPPSPKHMSLDLELNLPCGPSSSSVGPNHDHHHHHVADNFTKNTNKTGDGSGGLRRAPSCLACDDQGEEEEEQEMVTAVCKKCHMLVMMFNSTPACPNCKFVHPPDQTSPGLFNSRGLSLLC